MQKRIFERMAQERNISVEEVRVIIPNKIEKGWNYEEPARETIKKKFPVLDRYQCQMNG